MKKSFLIWASSFFVYIAIRKETSRVNIIVYYTMDTSIINPNPLSNLQEELLKLFSYNVSEEELLKVKDFIGKLFLNKLSDEVNKAIEDKNITNDDLEKWLYE